MPNKALFVVVQSALSGQPQTLTVSSDVDGPAVASSQPAQHHFGSSTN